VLCCCSLSVIGCINGILHMERWQQITFPAAAPAMDVDEDRGLMRGKLLLLKITTSRRVSSLPRSLYLACDSLG